MNIWIGKTSTILALARQIFGYYIRLKHERAVPIYLQLCLKKQTRALQVARARAERERLMDALEALEPQLSRARATSVGEQGPKTREAIRNRLAPQNQNKLRND